MSCSGQEIGPQRGQGSKKWVPVCAGMTEGAVAAGGRPMVCVQGGRAEARPSLGSGWALGECPRYALFGGCAEARCSRELVGRSAWRRNCHWIRWSDFALDSCVGRWKGAEAHPGCAPAFSVVWSGLGVHRVSSWSGGSRRPVPHTGNASAYFVTNSASTDSMAARSRSRPRSAWPRALASSGVLLR